MLKFRHLFGVLLANTLVIGLLYADAAKNDTPTKKDSKTVVDDSAIRQAAMKRQFDDFVAQLRLIAKSMAASTDANERARAKSIEVALRKASDDNISGLFDSITLSLKKKGANKDIDVLTSVVSENKKLTKALRMMISLLLQDDRSKLLAKRRETLAKLIKEIKVLKSREGRLQAQTDQDKRKNDELKKDQEKIRKELEKILKKLTPEEKKDGDKVEKTSKLEELQALIDAGDQKKVEDFLKRLGSSGRNMKAAESKLGKGKRGSASDSEAAAISDINAALNILEDLLNQVREEEKERKLRDLLARCERMLKIQEAVRDGTETLDKAIRKTGKEATTEHTRRSVNLADKQDMVARDASAALKLLKDEGEALSFVEGFQQIEKDADTVRRRLNRTDVGKVTLAIEEDIIDSLKDMINALKKAIKEPEKPRPGEPGEPGDPSEKKPLVNFLQQLKMVHALQRRVNDRTKLYGRQYPGEQAPTSGKTEKEKKLYKEIREEMQDLAKRQKKLGTITKELSKKAPPR